MNFLFNDFPFRIRALFNAAVVIASLSAFACFVLAAYHGADSLFFILLGVSIFILFCIAEGLFFLNLDRKILRRIESFSASMEKRLDAGCFPVRAAFGAEGVFDLFAAKFNSLLDQIQSREQSLAKYEQQLQELTTIHVVELAELKKNLERFDTEMKLVKLELNKGGQVNSCYFENSLCTKKKNKMQGVGGFDDCVQDSPLTPLLDEKVFFNARILLVDDSEINRSIAKEMLELTECVVEVAVDGFDAVEKWSNGKYDLLLMDCQMPRMDGYEATILIREKEEFSNLPRTCVVALSGSEMEEERERCITSGMDDFLSKPFTLKQLVSILSRWLPTDIHRVNIEEEGECSIARSAVFKNNALADFASEVHIDDEALKYIQALQSEGESDLIAQAVGIYLEDTPKLIQDIRMAIMSSNPKALHRAAHKLKSASAVLGAKRLAEECRRMEKMGELDGASEAEHLLEEIEAEYELVSAMLTIKCEEIRI